MIDAVGTMVSPYSCSVLRDYVSWLIHVFFMSPRFCFAPWSQVSKHVSSVRLYSHISDRGSCAVEVLSHAMLSDYALTCHHVVFFVGDYLHMYITGV